MYDATLAETVTIRGHGGDEIEAYLARPMNSGPFGSVVVIHHMPGYDEPTKEIARTFAVHGYNALTPNLYYRDARGAGPDDAGGAARAEGVTVVEVRHERVEAVHGERPRDLLGRL